MDEIEDKASESRRPGNPAWVKGGPSPNPGGQPEWVVKARDALREAAPEAAAYLRGVINGTAKIKFVDDDGKETERDVMPKERIAAAKVVLDFTVAKPKETTRLEVDAASSALAGLTTDELRSLLAAVNKPH